MTSVSFSFGRVKKKNKRKVNVFNKKTEHKAQFFFWYRWWDLNPHGFPLAPEASASAIPPHLHINRTNCLSVRFFLFYLKLSLSLRYLSKISL